MKGVTKKFRTGHAADNLLECSFVNNDNIYALF